MNATVGPRRLTPRVRCPPQLGGSERWTYEPCLPASSSGLSPRRCPTGRSCGSTLPPWLRVASVLIVFGLFFGWMSTALADYHPAILRFAAWVRRQTDSGRAWRAMPQECFWWCVEHLIRASSCRGEYVGTTTLAPRFAAEEAWRSIIPVQRTGGEVAPTVCRGSDSPAGR